MMRYVFLILFSILTIIILWINLGLIPGNYTYKDTKSDIILQLNFLESELKHNHLADRMQKTYPEGLVFINSLYGLAWCELALSDSGHDPSLKTKALKEALYAYREVISEKAKLPFDKTLYPECGMYYFGWKNYLLSKILALDTTFAGHEILIREYNSGCYALEKILTEKENPYTQTYKGDAWPADMFVAVAALKNYDRIFGVRYESEINAWLERVRKRLDPVTGLIPHKVNPGSGDLMQNPRGSSTSLTLRMLSEINPGFAAEQYALLKKDFASAVLGLPYLREYPKGVDGIGDIDSGPVVFGVGFSGTVVMIGTYAALGQMDLSDMQYRVINTFGFGINSGEKKRYLFGKFPMADAFIAWGRASGLNQINNPQNGSPVWFVQIHIISLFIIAILWLFFFRKKIFK